MCDRLRIFTPTGTTQGQRCWWRMRFYGTVIVGGERASGHKTLLSSILYPLPVSVWHTRAICHIFISKILSCLSFQDIARGGRPGNVGTIPCGVHIVPGHIQSPVQRESAPIRTVVKLRGIETIKLTTHLLIEQKLQMCGTTPPFSPTSSWQFRTIHRYL